MYIVFDIGRTNTRVGMSNDFKKVEGTKIINSTDSLSNIAQTIIQTALELAGKNKIEAIAGGITAVIDSTRGKKLAELIGSKIKTPIFIENDTALVGLGEAHFGAGKNFSIIQYMTVSSGIGGARIVNGKIDVSAEGFEPGHQIIKFDDDAYETLENLASGRGVKQQFNKEPKEIRDEKTWEELAKTLAVGVYNSMLHWSPEVIILGGPMITGDPRISIEKVEEHIKKLTKIFQKVPEIKKAELESFGGLYGALILIKQNK